MPVRTLLLTIHILSIAAWFGGGLGGTFLRSRLLRQGGPVAVAALKASEAMGTRFFGPASGLTLLSGIGLVLSSDGAYGFGDLFVVLGMTVFLVSAVGNSAFAGAREKKALEAYESGNDEAGQAAIVSTRGFVVIEVLLLTATLVAMVYRWGA
ncbi:MAG: hypothetical protein WAN34_11295 [Acidimicrobiia bacterium]